MTAERILVLGGGPDSEREVSLVSSQAVADALTAAGCRVRREVVDRIDAPAIRALNADAVFPVLHGPWGEGGPLQDVLRDAGVPFVGCDAPAARLAMDKMATKLAAAGAGVPTLPACVLNERDPAPPLPLPVVVKPIHEGSSVGVSICRDMAGWEEALRRVASDRAQHPLRTYMVERAAIGARELTVGWLDGRTLPIVEIKPGVEFYDYEAKYNRDDTRYECDPKLPGDIADRVKAFALATAKAVGVRHLARIDFLLDADNKPWLLEVNTMPGFTGHSLFPMAAAHAGIPFPQLAATLVRLALRDAGRSFTPALAQGR